MGIKGTFKEKCRQRKKKHKTAVALVAVCGNSINLLKCDDGPEQSYVGKYCNDSFMLRDILKYLLWHGICFGAVPAVRQIPRKDLRVEPFLSLLLQK